MLSLSIIPMIIIMMWTIFYLISKTEKTDKLLASSFECGYTPYHFSRFSFSMHYFIVSLIFLFLDLELSLMIPFFFLFPSNWEKMMILMIFSTTVIFGLILEWKEGKLEWKY